MKMQRENRKGGVGTGCGGEEFEVGVWNGGVGVVVVVDGGGGCCWGELKRS